MVDGTSFSRVEVMPDISPGNKDAMLQFFTSLNFENNRVDTINDVKSRHTEQVFDDILFTLQRFINHQVWTLDIIYHYGREPRPVHNIFDSYTILSIASFQSMGPFETLYSQKNKPDIFRVLSTEAIFSKAIFNHAYQDYDADSKLNKRESQPYFSAFLQVDSDLNRFNLDELVTAYEISAFFNDNQGEGYVDFNAFVALSYLYEKFPFELIYSKTEQEIGIERNLVRYFEGLKASSMSIGMQLSATDTLAVTGSHVEVSLMALIKGDIPAFIIDRIEQPHGLSHEIWEAMLTGELYTNIQEEYRLQTQRIKEIDEYIKETEDIIKNIKSPEEYIRNQITRYSSLNPEQTFSVSIINRPPDRLRGNIKERNKFIQVHPPTVKNFTVYDIITGRAEHELSRYRLTDLLIDWEDNSDLAYITQYRDWIINGYSDYIDSIDADRIDHYFTLLQEISGKGKVDKCLTKSYRIFRLIIIQYVFHTIF
ncbi:hypothetical protein HQQ94_19010 [Shewanella sp. VB17]|uniref:hypothetical protein n=1 Tax=Shewanella sp. VB17 TaxID=2739432 RepID=UPI001563D396|nr:hypothetical protein [Shewanella sp. VB17]NRD75273.1 hypothetical protein [Shewanella sp. VB17]